MLFFVYTFLDHAPEPRTKFVPPAPKPEPEPEVEPQIQQELAAARASEAEIQRLFHTVMETIQNDFPEAFRAAIAALRRVCDGPGPLTPDAGTAPA